MVGGAATAGHRSPARSSPARRRGPSARRSSTGPRGAMAPLNLPVRTARRRPAGPPSSPRRSGATAPTAPSGRRTRPSPTGPIRIWQVWNEPNFKYFVARPNPAEYGQAGQALQPGDQGRRPGRQDRPRRALRRGQGKPTSRANRRRPTSRPTSSNSCTGRRRASSRSSTASRCIHTPTTTGTYRPTSKNCAPSSRPTRIPARASGSPSSAGAPSGPTRARQRFRKGAERPGEAAEGRLPAAQAQPDEMADQADLLVLGRRQSRAPATSATAPASSAPASSPGRLVSCVSSPAASRLVRAGGVAGIVDRPGGRLAGCVRSVG